MTTPHVCPVHLHALHPRQCNKHGRCEFRLNRKNRCTSSWSPRIIFSGGTSVCRSSDPNARGSGQLHFILNITKHKSYTMRVEDVQLSLLPGRILTDDGGQVGCQDSIMMLSCTRPTLRSRCPVTLNRGQNMMANRSSVSGKVRRFVEGTFGPTICHTCVIALR